MIQANFLMQRSQFPLQGDQKLARTVVQFQPEASPLLVLRSHESVVQFPQAFVSLFQFGGAFLDPRLQLTSRHYLFGYIDALKQNAINFPRQVSHREVTKVEVNGFLLAMTIKCYCPRRGQEWFTALVHTIQKLEVPLSVKFGEYLSRGFADNLRNVAGNHLDICFVHESKFVIRAIDQSHGGGSLGERIA